MLARGADMRYRQLYSRAALRQVRKAHRTPTGPRSGGSLRGARGRRGTPFPAAAPLPCCSWHVTACCRMHCSGLLAHKILSPKPIISLTRKVVLDRLAVSAAGAGGPGRLHVVGGRPLPDTVGCEGAAKRGKAGVGDGCGGAAPGFGLYPRKQGPTAQARRTPGVLSWLTSPPCAWSSRRSRGSGCRRRAGWGRTAGRGWQRH